MGNQEATSTSVGALIERIDAAVQLDCVDAITGRIKAELEQVNRDGSLRLPEEFRRPGSECYARRLLHRDADLGYTMVVMAWGPGQKTCLHDHAGIWCVECVVDGRLEVTQYDLLGQNGDRYQFEEKSCVKAGIGDAGRLIPPFDYHVIANGLPDRTSISLHVYGGEMDHCNLFTPAANGGWEKTTRQLSYNS